MGRPRKHPLPTQQQVEGEAPQASVAAPLIRSAEKPKKSGSVTVACKIPQGLKLQLQHKISRPMPAGRGGDNDYVMTDINVFGGKAYHVFGPSMPAMGGVPDGYILPPSLEGGFAFTPGIPADFWEQWLEQNKLADYVINRMIFALEPASVKAKATELKAEKSGLEPLSRERDDKGQLKDSRIPKPLTGSLGRIAYDAERDAERGNHSAE